MIIRLIKKNNVECGSVAIHKSQK